MIQKTREQQHALEDISNLRGGEELEVTMTRHYEPTGILMHVRTASGQLFHVDEDGRLL